MTLPAIDSRWWRGALVLAALLIMLVLAQPVHAQAVAPPAAIPGALDRAFGELSGAQSKGSMALSLQLLLLMGLLTILPSLLLMMTSFTRILIVLSLLRQALGLQQSPPNPVLIGLSLFLSLFVMAPTLDRVNAHAIQPYASGAINAEAAFVAGGGEFHSFMIRQTRQRDLLMFAEMAHVWSRASLSPLFRSCCRPLSPAS